MNRRVLIVLFLAFVACRKVGKDVEQQGFRILGSNPVPEESVDLGPPPKPEAILVQVHDQPQERYDIMIEPEDSLELYAKWTGRSVKELLRLNPEVRERGLVPGEIFHLFLTRIEFNRFSGSRTGYLMLRRNLEKNSVITRASHTVKQNESLTDILLKYPTTIDLLERENPNIRIDELRANQVIVIPIVSEEQRDRPALPGPKPPAPPPVPVPPQDPKPLTTSPSITPKNAKPVTASSKMTTKNVSPAKTTGIYVVQRGDVIGTVAKQKLKVSIEDLRKANPGVNLDRVRPGQKLKVPRH